MSKNYKKWQKLNTIFHEICDWNMFSVYLSAPPPSHVNQPSVVEVKEVSCATSFYAMLPMVQSLYSTSMMQLQMMLFPNALCCSLYECNCVCTVTKFFTKFLPANNFCQLLRVTCKRSCIFRMINRGCLELVTSPIKCIWTQLCDTILHVACVYPPWLVA